MRANTDWFVKAKWGGFIHYLAESFVPADILPTEQGIAYWNCLVDGFDVTGLAEQLAKLGAGYFFLTLGQNSGYFLSPNAIYDGLVKRTPSRLSQRDLPSDLAEALAKVNIPLMVYLPGAAPCRDQVAIRGLRCTPPWDAALLGFPPESVFPEDATRTDERMTEFQQNWEAIIREWSLRWGTKVHGWWVDGCYQADRMYRNPDAPNFASYAAAMKAGNPDSLVAFNPGVMVPVISHSEFEDYTAGEISGALPVSPDNPWQSGGRLSRYVDGAQLHILSYLGYGWCASPPRFSDELVGAYTRFINRAQGVMTWDMPPQESGLLSEPFFAQLKAALG
jgi:hypothetical protein